MLHFDTIHTTNMYNNTLQVILLFENKQNLGINLDINFILACASLCIDLYCIEQVSIKNIKECTGFYDTNINEKKILSIKKNMFK